MERAYLQLEISEQVMAELINSGQLTCENLRALNAGSRDSLRALLLASLKS